MPRRITVPDDHVAVVLSSQLADELMNVLRHLRQSAAGAADRVKNAIAQPSELDSIKAQTHNICGDVMLALLEAKES